MILELYSRAMPHNILRLWVEIVFVQFLEPLLKLPNLVLEMDDIVPWYLCALRLVEVFAVGVRSLAWSTSRKSWIASGFPLRPNQHPFFLDLTPEDTYSSTAATSC